MKTDTPGFLDVKLVVISKDAAPWLDALGELGTLDHEAETGGWRHRVITTGAVLRDLTVRVMGYVGPPTADVVVAYVGADRIVSDGTTEIPDVSIADVPRTTGTPSKDTLLGALKDVLRGAAAAT